MSQDGRRFQAAVRSTSGLATTVVRALDAAGVVVDDVEVRPPSLDDVFFSLTGHRSRGRGRWRRRTRAHVDGGVGMTAATVLAGRGRQRSTGRGLPPGCTTWSCSPDAIWCTSRREPLQLSDVTVQPVLFTLLFIYVFGSGVPIQGGSYKDFAIAGLMLLNLTTSAMGTAVGLVSDLTTGAIDRFRTLPIWRSAVLVGRSVADLLSAALCISIVAVTGLCIGWRPDASAASILAGFGVALLFSYALSWACACLGIVSKGPESAQGSGSSSCFRWPSSPTPWYRRRGCRAGSRPSQTGTR